MIFVRRMIRKKGKHARAGITLLELMVGLVLMALVAFGVIKASSMSKFTAEQNLYESTAVNTAIGLIEQMKGTNYNSIANPPVDADGDEIFSLRIADGTSVSLKLGKENDLLVPIITESGGKVGKTLNVKITPSLTRSNTLVKSLNNTTEYAGYWVTIDYSWNHPRSGKAYSGVYKNLISLVSSY